MAAVDGTVGADQEQPRGLPPPGDQREQIDGRRIAPVQVLEHEHEGRFGRQRLDHLRHLAQHPLARGPQELALQRVPVRASRSHGICTSQVGACRRRSGTSQSPATPRQSRARASSTGR